jgi:uncharacterized protein YkwD
MRGLAVGIAALALSVVALAPGSTVALGAPPEGERVVALVNRERVQRGLFPLAPDPRLAAAAETYAARMAALDFFGHTGPDGSRMRGRNEAQGYVGWRVMGENLAGGQATPERVVQRWMASPGHRANVLAPDACQVGVGYAYGNRSTYKHYWVMEVGC